VPERTLHYQEQGTGEMNVMGLIKHYGVKAYEEARVLYLRKMQLHFTFVVSLGKELGVPTRI